MMTSEDSRMRTTACQQPLDEEPGERQGAEVDERLIESSFGQNTRVSRL